MRHGEKDLPRDIQSADTPFALLSSYAQAINVDDAQEVSGDLASSNYLGFSAGGEYFLLSVEDVRSVFSEIQLVTHLPFSPKWLLGLTSIRSEIVSVVSFADLWRPDRELSSKSYHYILLAREGEGFLLRVDGLYGIHSMDVGVLTTQDRFVDGKIFVDGKNWQRINVTTLLEKELMVSE